MAHWQSIEGKSKMKFWKYIKAAFNARPLGMPIPPIYLGLAAFGILGVINPGFLIIGAGLGMAYVFGLASSKRFQLVVEGQEIEKANKAAKDKISETVFRLRRQNQERYQNLVERCRTIIRQQSNETPDYELAQQAQGLSRLANMYLQLLVSKEAIERMPKTPAVQPSRIKTLERRLADPDIKSDLKHSLTGQLEILRQRIKHHEDASEKYEFVDSELTRIEQQVELLREQTVASTAPSIVSERIDNVTSTLSITRNYLNEHKELMAEVEDMVSAPPIVQTN